MMETGGGCCYIGIPYFKNVAKFYLERAPGTAGTVFDLYNVYRYTHGDPERAPDRWLEQLHKSLFNEEEIITLLSQSGFGSFVIFCYGFPGDVHELPVNLGFYGSCESRPLDELRSGCLVFLERFADWRIRMNTLEWVGS